MQKSDKTDMEHIEYNVATGMIGYAEYIYNVQFPNSRIPPGTAFRIDAEIYNSVPAFIVASNGAGGTIFTLGPGAYIIDCEMSLPSATSIAIYSGPDSKSLSMDTNTISGSSSRTSWIHGRAVEHVSTSFVIAISSIAKPSHILNDIPKHSYMIRLTILKVM